MSVAKRTTKRATNIRTRRALLRKAASKDAPMLIDTLAAFFLKAGLSRRIVAAELRACADRVEREAPVLAPNTQRTHLQLAGALRRWWHDPEYVDENGLPKPLPLVGASPSVASLIEQHVDSDARHDAIAILRKSVRVERDGRWKPDASRRFIRAFGEDGIKRLQVSLAGILQTFIQNQLSVRAPGQENFDRTATVLRFPQALLPELRQTLHKRLMLTIEDVDRILSEADNHPKRGEASEVGFAMYLYDFPEGGKPKRRRYSGK
jgi:hypothetical protein